uniref:Uncharacterized protein n=1 Tax=Ananas comosus var. bracteatus TaxID=296719 RepID=A0A6V7Q367_ANACO|nr:unnamed protein product [Ananas comosus var. bracteatus]
MEHRLRSQLLLKKKRIIKQVAWADEVGRPLVEVKRCHDDSKETVLASSKSPVSDLRGEANVVQQLGKERDSPTGSKLADFGRDKGACNYSPPLLLLIRRCSCGERSLNPQSSPICRERSLVPRDLSPKVYEPYTEEYLRRKEIRRNAVLADVIKPANLGPNPQLSIARALARRFGGYNQDFAVARYRDRDFAIFLPDWVSAETLVRREILTLDDIWIRCFPWGLYRNTRPHRLPLRAWIRLINLPFECWTVTRVAAMVGGFGRFVKADETTKAMTDLRAFRCQITLDSLGDIPHYLSVVLGEELFAVTVHLESWERALEGGNNGPSAPLHNGSENGIDHGREGDNNHQADAGHEGSDEAMEDEEEELDEACFERSIILAPRSAAELGAKPGARSRLSVGERQDRALGTGGATFVYRRRRRVRANAGAAHDERGTVQQEKSHPGGSWMVYGGRWTACEQRRDAATARVGSRLEARRGDAGRDSRAWSTFEDIHTATCKAPFDSERGPSRDHKWKWEPLLLVPGISVSHPRWAGTWSFSLDSRGCLKAGGMWGCGPVMLKAFYGPQILTLTWPLDNSTTVAASLTLVGACDEGGGRDLQTCDVAPNAGLTIPLCRQSTSTLGRPSVAPQSCWNRPFHPSKRLPTWACSDPTTTAPATLRLGRVRDYVTLELTLASNMLCLGRAPDSTT